MTRPVRDGLDEFNPNKGPSAAQASLLGKAMSQNMGQTAVLAVASNVAVLPEGFKAAQVLHAYAAVCNFPNCGSFSRPCW